MLKSETISSSESFPARGQRSLAGQAPRLAREASLYVGLALIFILGIVASPIDPTTGAIIFLSPENQSSVLRYIAQNGILAVGMTLVILTAGIDLSVGRLLGLGSTLAAMLMIEKAWTPAAWFTLGAAALSAGVLAALLVRAVFGGKAAGRRDAALSALAFVTAAGLIAAWMAPQAPAGLSILTVLIVVPLAGLALGSVSGVIIAKARLQPFIVTLAMMTTAYGAARLLSEGGKIKSLYDTQGNTPPGVDWLRTIDMAAIAAALPAWMPDALTGLLRSGTVTTIAGLAPVPGLFFLVCLLAGMFALNRLRFGRYVYAVGGNEEAARLSGVNVDRVKITVYAVSGMLAFLAGVLACAQYRQGKADMGQLAELDAIAAVVIGGTSLLGGRGRMAGTLVGVLMFGYLTNILTLKGLSTDVQYFITGVIIVEAVLLQEGAIQRLPKAWQPRAVLALLLQLGLLLLVLNLWIGLVYLNVFAAGAAVLLLWRLRREWSWIDAALVYGPCAFVWMQAPWAGIACAVGATAILGALFVFRRMREGEVG